MVKHSILRSIFLAVSPAPLLLMILMLLRNPGWEMIAYGAMAATFSGSFLLVGIVLAAVSKATGRPWGAFVIGALIGGTIAIFYLMTIAWYLLAGESQREQHRTTRCFDLEEPVELREAVAHGSGRSAKLLLVGKDGGERLLIFDDEEDSRTRYELISPYHEPRFAGMESFGHHSHVENGTIMFLRGWLGENYGFRMRRILEKQDYPEAYHLLEKKRKEFPGVDPLIVLSVLERLEANIPPLSAERNDGMFVGWESPAVRQGPDARKVRLRRGDSFYSLSLEYYGMHSRMITEAILRANPGLDEGALNECTEIVIPPLDIPGRRAVGKGPMRADAKGRS